MKKILSLTLVAAMVIGLASCKKNSSTDNGTNSFYTAPVVPTPVSQVLPVGSIPMNFSQKAVIEEFTGEWCGNCPGGAQVMHDLISANPNKVYGVAIHQNDPMETPFYNTISGYFTAGGSVGSIGFPCGIVSRSKTIDPNPEYQNTVLMSRTYWGSALPTALNRKVKCGIAMITKNSGDNLDIDVYVSNKENITEDTRLTVYLLENDVPESAPGAQAGGGPGYLHQHVLRKVISADLGDAINLTTIPKDKYTLVKYNGINLAGLYKDKSNLKVLVMVTVNAATADKYDVLNAQEAGINETKKWD
jgi:hypothetical protein